ncbi:Protein of unknown function (DUF3089) [Novosphingobium sp. AP12]|nr:Protein of unknown function (DUF3089) [Novosphingobium sp. AP12]
MMRWLVLLAASALPVAEASAATPQEDIAASASAAPDYADPASWAAGPSGAGPAGALPEGATPAARDPGVDVFYVHPTTFRSQTLWSQDIADAKANAWVDESVVARQASVFGACCRIWAPRYRAASYKALGDPAYRDAAFAFAYSDVERAFDWFLANVSKGRPFIIAGHSQGAKHVADLLERRIDGTPLRKRMVAAYIIGINLSEGEFGLRYKHVPICDSPAQTGCALQWNAIEAGSDLEPMVSAFEKGFVQKYGDVPGKKPLCINPVTFDRRRPASLSAEAKGAVPGEPGSGPMKPLRAGAVAVNCERGLAVSYLAPGLDLKTMPGGSLHYHDFGLFYADIRANAALRVAAWLKAHR